VALTRRRFLLGAGAGIVAAAGASAVGAQTGRGRRLLHTAGLLDGNDRSIPRADLSVDAGRLRNGQRYLITRTGHTAQPALAVACLHGRNNDERFAFDTIGLPASAAAAGLDIVVASLASSPGSYWHRRTSGEDPMAALIDELVPLMDARSQHGPRAVMGWSMGGYGALLAAEEHPGVFANVVAASPAVWRRAADTAPGAFDGPDDFRAHDVLGGAARLTQPLPVRVRIDCGADDPFVSTSKELLSAIPDVQGGIRPGFHDAAYWRTLVPDQLRFLTTGT